MAQNVCAIPTYTTGTLGTVLDTISYGYGDTSWHDLLTSYDGQPLTTDAIGNLTNDGTWSYTWQHGRQLKQMSRPDGTGDVEIISFCYDSSGHRIGKDSGTYHISYYGGEAIYAGDTTPTSYSYLGDTLTQVSIGSTSLRFTYDELGPASVNYNGTTYYYLKNAQGDVTGIVNSSGTQVVAYTYDAWGKLLSTTGSMSTTLGQYNPLRYRGYVYDAETGLYYLQSRYYNPQTGRFINADSLISAEDLLGTNMFAYCENNPVTRHDAAGQLWDTVFDVISLCISVVEVVNNPKSGSAWLGLAADVLCLALPVLTGGGSAVRAANTVKKATSAANKVDNISDTARLVRAADKIGDASKIGGYVDDAAKVADTALSTSMRSESGLSFGIKSYSALKKETKGLGLEVHHIVEKRFADSLGVTKNSMPSIALAHDNHVVYTRSWRQNLPYGCTYSPAEIWSAAQRVYADNQELLNASRITIFGS